MWRTGIHLICNSQFLPVLLTMVLVKTKEKTVINTHIGWLICHRLKVLLNQLHLP